MCHHTWLNNIFETGCCSGWPRTGCTWSSCLSFPHSWGYRHAPWLPATVQYMMAGSTCFCWLAHLAEHRTTLDNQQNSNTQQLASEIYLNNDKSTGTEPGTTTLVTKGSQSVGGDQKTWPTHPSVSPVYLLREARGRQLPAQQEPSIDQQFISFKPEGRKHTGAVRTQQRKGDSGTGHQDSPENTSGSRAPCSSALQQLSEMRLCQATSGWAGFCLSLL